jgi:peptidoglycan hydrolase-like protein with peptidoglycan-binding domain
MVANAALLAEIQTMQTAIMQVLAQVQSIQTQLSQLEAQVNAGSGSGISANASAVITTPSGASYNFTELLTVGSQDAEVTALQGRLTALGFYSGPITGYYGSLTGQAVSKYQTAHGIAVTGYVGPSTRTALNAGN